MSPSQRIARRTAVLHVLHVMVAASRCRACMLGALAILLGPEARAQLVATWETSATSMWTSASPCAGAHSDASSAVGSGEAASGRLAIGQRRRVSVVVSAAAGRGTSDCGNAWSASAAVRSTFAVRGFDIWTAYAASRAVSPDTAVRQPGWSAGMERRIGRALLSVSVGPRRDRTSMERAIELHQRLLPETIWPVNGGTLRQETTYVADTVTRFGSRRAPDLGLGVRWRRSALGIDAGAYLAMAGPIRRADPLARLELTYALTSRVSAVAGASARTALRAFDVPGMTAATLAVRIAGSASPSRVTAPASSTASDFRVVAIRDGAVAIAVRARAERVEIAGDFTHWDPVALSPSRDGWWRAEVRASPGPHRVSMRVDAGRWVAPPGLAPLRDEFGDTVGLLVVR